MAWFGKKKEEIGSGENGLSLPELPKLPELPDLERNYGGKRSSLNLPQLPSYPNNPLGEKMSQNFIKDAVSGEKEEYRFDADEFPDDEETMPKPFKSQVKMAAMPEEDYSRKFSAMRSSKPEPVFVRLDKFEDSLKIFDDARRKISEMESMLKNIRKIKEEEERELKEWEGEVQKIKGEFEKINSELFSRI